MSRTTARVRRRPPAPVTGRPAHAADDPDGGHGVLHDLLIRAVEEAARLLDADGAMVYLLDPRDGLLHFAHDSGIRDAHAREVVRSIRLPVGTGMFGRAVAEREVVVTDDYLEDPSFPHAPEPDRVVRDVGLRSMVVAPLVSGDEVFGALGTYSHGSGVFTEAQVTLVRSLADHAAAAMANTRLLERIERSSVELRERAERERALREITARLAAIRDPRDLLQHVVDEAARLVRADGAILDTLDPAGRILHWAYDSGLDRMFSPAERADLWIEVGVGATGRALSEDRVIVAGDDLVALFPESPQSTLFFERTGFRSIIAAPITAESGPLGVLEVYSTRSDAFDARDGDLIAALAAQAAVAMTNARLLERLGESEARYRYLVQNAPDLIWATDGEGRLTFLSDTCQRLTGWLPDELLGQHFGALVHPSSREVAEMDWTTTMTAPTSELRGRLDLLHRDGHPIPAEFIALARRDEAGRFLGANGSVRDMTERDRLERELQASEIRYRTLVSSSPDLVFATDAEGRYTFMSDRTKAVMGWDPVGSMGRHFMEYVAPGSEQAAAASYAALVADPASVHTARIEFLHGDGTAVPLEINVVGSFADGRLTAIHGVARDVSEREGLERELRASEERYRYLVSASPDLVWATDPDGRLTFVSEASEAILGRPWRELVGRPFADVFPPAIRRDAEVRFAWLRRHPTTVHRSRLPLRHADGHEVIAEINGIGMLDADGRFVGAHGSARDVSERDRLERDLRRQAGELAAGEERAHLARELHDSVTQALFSMTLVARSAELLLDRDPEAARGHLVQLRDLQREALAEMRALIFELRPGNLEQDGLSHALRTHTAALQARIGLPIVVEAELAERLPLRVEEALYRIAQEALHNVVKHAAARQVRLEVRRLADDVRMLVEDDGTGFDPDSVPDGHLGLAGMRVRAERIGARFVCRSEPGRGTLIEVVVPVG